MRMLRASHFDRAFSCPSDVAGCRKSRGPRGLGPRLQPPGHEEELKRLELEIPANEPEDEKRRRLTAQARQERNQEMSRYRALVVELIRQHGPLSHSHLAVLMGIGGQVLSRALKHRRFRKMGHGRYGLNPLMALRKPGRPKGQGHENLVG